MLKKYFSSKRAPIFTILIVGVLSLLLLFILKPQKKTKESNEKVWNIAVMTLKLGDYQPDLILYGTLDNPRHSLIRSAIEADVVDTPVYSGNIVKKNQVILKLDDREIQLIQQQRRADVDNLHAKIEEEMNRHDFDKQGLAHEQSLMNLDQKAVARQQKLLKQHVGSEAAYEAATEELEQRKLTVNKRTLTIKNHSTRLSQLNAQLARANALLDDANIDLEKTTIRAPFDGRISELHVAIRQRVQIGNPLIDVYDVGGMEVKAQIPTHYLHEIYQALAQQKSVQGYVEINQRAIPITLNRLAGEVNSGQGGVDGYFKVANGQQTDLELGRPVKLVVKLPIISNSYLVPAKAIYGGNRLYLVKHNQLEGVEVKRLGIIYGDNNHTIIQSEKLQENDKVLITTLPNARTGLRVEIK